MNPEKCAHYWGEVGTNCGICFSVCPFSKGHEWYHDGTRWFIENVPTVDPLWVSLDDALGYGAHWDPEEYWREE